MEDTPLQTPAPAAWQANFGVLEFFIVAFMTMAVALIARG